MTGQLFRKVNFIFVMKRLSVLFFSLLVVLSTFAQDGKKAFKTASKALSSFNMGGGTDEEQLKEAIAAIEEAMQSSEYQNDSKAWSTRGEIYNAVVTQHMTAMFINENHEIIDVEAPFKAYESYKKALALAEKKWEQRNALKGLSESVTNLNSVGVTYYDAQEYGKAYKAFNSMLEIHDLLKENGEKSTLDEPDNYNNQLYITGLAAFYGNDLEAAEPLFTELKDNGFEEAAVYDALYKINVDSNPNEAVKYLEQGREKFPEETSLLFTEINHYLKAGKMDVLETKLKEAIKVEPENYALYYTLARVYVDASAATEDEVAKEDYFNKTLEQYNAALKVKPDFYEAVYGIGELYYNKAAIISQAMQELGNSSAELKKYDEMKLQMEAEFDKALPYFKESEKMNPNDVNTLVALSEIYARKNDFEMVSEFKVRLEKAQAGEENESYFKNN